MQAVKKALIAAASVGALALMAAAPAQAATLIDFRWNPSASSPALTAGTSIFTSQNLTVGDYAKIDLSGGLTGIQETAILNVTSLNQFANGDPISPLIPNGFSGAGYQLYFLVSAVSNLAPSAGGFSGTFTSLTYSLIGVQGGGCTFDVASVATGPTALGCGTKVTLANGSLLPGGVNSVGIDSSQQPHASVDTTIVAGAGAGSFFVNPSNLSGFLFESAFTNTQAVTYYCTASGVVGGAGCTAATAGGQLNFANGTTYILIDGGGGNVNMLAIPVPEPVTLSVFGAGLVGAAALRRRKAKKA